ncbi:VanW family protein [Desulfitobacterium sp. Sab5]|uniref:VanW family protein n=1 Tax=Desulfitobacterium nosdiversum TaxID=3375356 RepID=UPI003CF0EE72
MRMLSILIIIATLLVTPGCTPGIWNSSQVPSVDSQSQRSLREGTFLDDLDLSGLKVQEVKDKIKSWEEDKLAQNLLLVYNKTEIPVMRKELGISLDFEKIWAQLWTAQGQRTASSLKVDTVQAHQMLHEKLAQFNQAAVDASYTIENNQFIIKPAVPGRVVQEDSILEQFQNRSFTDLPGQIEVSAAEVPAAQTTEQLQTLAFDGIIGEYTTRFNAKDENRSTNLTLAANKMDKTLLKPGDTLSFNQTVGQRTPESGYKDAYVIINNEYVPGVGGGICQVSSTLYSAAVLANLPIVERYPHAMAISYIPLGQDATVNYPDLDLKFKNNTASFIYIRTEVKPGILTIRLYGKKTGKTVRFEQQIEKETDFQTIRRIDPNLSPGQVVQDQAGYKGYTVKTYRIIKDSSGALDKQLLTQDEYAPTPKILRIGAD